MPPRPSGQADLEEDLQAHPMTECADNGAARFRESVAIVL